MIQIIDEPFYWDGEVCIRVWFEYTDDDQTIILTERGVLWNGDIHTHFMGACCRD